MVAGLSAVTLLSGFAPAQPVGWTDKGYPVWTEAQLALPPLPDAPEGATRIDAKLKGYVFGIKVIDADYDGWVGAETYALRSNLETAGLGALVQKLRVWAVTEGRWDATGLYPVRHLQQNRDKKKRRVEMEYGPDRVEVSVIPPNGSQGTPPASMAEKVSSDDTLSSLLNIMMRRTFMGAGMCAGTVPVFDSKQHYALRLVDRGADDRKLGDYAKVVGGPVRRCDIYYEPVSGFDAEDLPDADEGATPVKMWLGEVPDPGGGGYDVPMRFSYKISGFKAVIKVDRIAFDFADGSRVELD